MIYMIYDNIYINLRKSKSSGSIVCMGKKAALVLFTVHQ